MAVACAWDTSGAAEFATMVADQVRKSSRWSCRALRPQPGVHGVRIGEVVGAEAFHGDFRRGHAFPL